MCNQSGGDLLYRCLSGDSIDILGAEIDLLHQLRGLQTPEALFRRSSTSSHITAMGSVDPLVALRRVGSKSQRGEGRLDWVLSCEGETQCSLGKP